MFDNNDLENAVRQGVFEAKQVENFKVMIQASAESQDSERFKFLGGFGDFFTMLSCLVVLFSIGGLAKPLLGDSTAALLVALCAWGLAEYFVRQRKMALTAIVLLISFVAAIFVTGLFLFSQVGTPNFIAACGLAALSAYAHWRRFKVPMTPAAGLLFVAAFVGVSFFDGFELTSHVVQLTFLCLGLVIFAVAMYWDSSDVERNSYHSDVAFWLHVLSAPLITHSLFALFGLLDGGSSVATMLLVVLFYTLLTCVSLVIDRRAFMVASLSYVVYAISAIIKASTSIGSDVALTGIIVGAALLVLSAYWGAARRVLLRRLPANIARKVPTAEA